MTVFENQERELSIWNDNDFRLIVWGLLIGSLLGFVVAQLVNVFRYVRFITT